MRIRAIALNTFKEAARNKVYYLLIFFGIFFAFSAEFISMVTIGDKVKVLKDIGLGSVHFFSVLIAVFTGINLIYKEIEKKTIYNILSKPISRGHFIIGKFSGLALTLFIALTLMAVVFMLLLLVFSGETDWRCLHFFGLLYVELLIITALSLLFSSFTTPILASIFTITLYLIGQVLWTYNEFKSRLHEPVSRFISKILYHLLPNLEKFNIKNQIVMGDPVSLQSTLTAVLYGIVYVAALLTLTIAIFQKREFK